MPHRLRAISVENYRSFKEPFRLELCPLTLVYGWNNAGKSAAVRLVKLLGDSLRERARAPLDGPVYRDLVWKPAVTKPGPLRYGLEWENNERATWRLDYDRDVSRMYVRELELVDSNGTARTLRALRSEGDDKYQWQTPQESEGEHTAFQVQFTGLIPKSHQPVLRDLSERLYGLRGNCRWLSGHRVAPPQFIPEGKPPPVEVDFNGAGATELLLANDALFSKVRDWYARPEIKRRLEPKVQEETARLLLNPIGASFDVELSDTGAGMGQVLPVLTTIASAQEAVQGGEEAIIAIEEPENQLHPNAQRALGTWLCEIASQDFAPKLVLETHSRVLVLAAQVAIAAGRIDKSKVAVYWLEQSEDGSTVARRVEFDRFGRPDANWPQEVFADEVELAEQLSELQFSHGAWGGSGQ